FLHVSDTFVIRQAWRTTIKLGIGFNRELIPGEMRWSAINCLAQIRQRIVETLLRQTKHQIEIEVVEASVARDLRCAQRFVAVMHSPETFQLRRIKTLNAYGKAIDATSTIGTETLLLKSAW